MRIGYWCTRLTSTTSNSSGRQQRLIRAMARQSPASGGRSRSMVLGFAEKGQSVMVAQPATPRRETRRLLRHATERSSQSCSAAGGATHILLHVPRDMMYRSHRVVSSWCAPFCEFDGFFEIPTIPALPIRKNRRLPRRRQRRIRRTGRQPVFSYGARLGGQATHGFMRKRRCVPTPNI